MVTEVISFPNLYVKLASGSLICCPALHPVRVVNILYVSSFNLQFGCWIGAQTCILIYTLTQIYQHVCNTKRPSSTSEHTQWEKKKMTRNLCEHTNTHRLLCQTRPSSPLCNKGTEIKSSCLYYFIHQLDELVYCLSDCPGASWPSVWTTARLITALSACVCSDQLNNEVWGDKGSATER